MLVNVPYLGDDLVLPGSGYLSLFESSLPAVPDLVGAYLFGGDISLGKNLATGEVDASINGAPAQQDGYAVLDGANYLQTKIMDTDAMSLFICGNNPSGVAAAYVGNLAGASGVSSGVAASTTGADFGSNLVRSSTWTTTNVTANPGDWFINSSRGASGVVNRTNSWLRNVASQGTNTNTRTLGTNPIRIGRAYTTQNVGAVRLSSVVIVQRNVSDAEAQQIVDWMASYARAYKLIA